MRSAAGVGGGGQPQRWDASAKIVVAAAVGVAGFAGNIVAAGTKEQLKPVAG